MKPHRRYALSLVFAAATAVGCAPPMDSECHTSEDCPGSTFCQMGQCTDLSGDPVSGHNLLDDNGDVSPSAVADVSPDTDVSIDGGVSEPSHPCPDAPPADAERLVLNEFLANVPMGDAGDANEDGVRHYHDDEFVELVNAGDVTIDLTGVALLSDTDVRFVFPEICLEPLHAVVVFGGLEPGATPPQGEGFTSLVSDSWFRYPQGGGRIVVQSANDTTIADHTYGSHPDGSLNLARDLDGDRYVAHRELADDGALFSPGTCADGRPFPTGCRDEEEKENAPESSDPEDSSPENQHEEPEDSEQQSEYANSKPGSD